MVTLEEKSGAHQSRYHNIFWTAWMGVPISLGRCHTWRDRIHPLEIRNDTPPSACRDTSVRSDRPSLLSLELLSLHVLPVLAWVFSRYSSFPPAIKTCSLGWFSSQWPRQHRRPLIPQDGFNAEYQIHYVAHCMIHPSIHSSVICSHLSFCTVGLEQIPGDTGQVAGYRWTSHQFITGLHCIIYD